MSSEQWRFGSVSILSNYLVSIVFGLMLLGALGVARGARGTLYFVTATSGLLALLLFVIMISYTLDTLQVWGSVREEQMEMFKIGAGKTLFKIALFFVASVALAVAALRSGRDISTDSARPLIRPV